MQPSNSADSASNRLYNNGRETNVKPFQEDNMAKIQIKAMLTNFHISGCFSISCYEGIKVWVDELLGYLFEHRHHTL